VFPSVFFPFEERLNGTLFSFAIFALAFVVRPLGTLLGMAVQRRYGREMKLTVALMMLGTGTRVVATEKVHAQGNVITTQNALDVAISGDGFFQVLQPDGTLAYTRDGGFKLSSTGQVVTSNGALLQPAITIPANASSVSFGTDGTVTVKVFGTADQQVLGNIQLARFVNPAGLESIGGNLLRANAASGPVQQLKPGTNGAGQLVQGALEASNVNVVEEMVNMIETQRAYEVNSKAISATDQMLKFVNSNL